MNGATLDRKISFGVLAALALQLSAALLWAGGAAERLDALEKAQHAARAEPVQLARLETRLDHIDAQLDRIEERLERRP
ncbi:MAG: hypothetical protein GVY09_16115 [Gammaproteobacteria bacterium]|jgi:hypothetical protein|nr:hypothetical protein [Gammaproteobacteria bacterium]